MLIDTISISGIRNLSDTALSTTAGFNLFSGGNGAGKTSVLEAIHVLSAGHSFRTRKAKELINRGGDSFTITAQLKDPSTSQTHRAGISKSRDGETSLKLNYEQLHSMADMARLIPVKALYPDSHQLIQLGPSTRRQFLDWGLFHVKQDFFLRWKQFKRALDQRNIALRKSLSDAEVQAWNHEIIDAGTILTGMRGHYVDLLSNALAPFIAAFQLDSRIDIQYKKGWNADFSLEEALERHKEQCRRFKTTTVGPHRAELSISIDGVNAKEFLSRGEQKLLVYALHFAQLTIFRDIEAKDPIVLCDDLIAELDASHYGFVVESLNSLGLQTFVTSNSPIRLTSVADVKMFHVEHGVVSEMV